MRRVVAGTLASGLFGLALLIPAATAGQDQPAKLRPNLRAMRIEQADVALRYNEAAGTRRLRFTTDVLNSGRGPFELGPRDNLPCSGDDDAYLAQQRVYLDANESGVYEIPADTETSTSDVGCFKYHDLHDHWHFQDFADYALFRIRADGTVRRIASERADKVSYCMLDTRAVSRDLPGKPAEAQYPSSNCRSDNPEEINSRSSGISIGWYDHYGLNLPGQAFNIKGLANGPYCLVVSLDPRNVLRETNNRDNVRTTWLEIQGREKVQVRNKKKCAAP